MLATALLAASMVVGQAEVASSETATPDQIFENLIGEWSTTGKMGDATWEGAITYKWAMKPTVVMLEGEIDGNSARPHNVGLWRWTAEKETIDAWGQNAEGNNWQFFMKILPSDGVFCLEGKAVSNGMGRDEPGATVRIEMTTKDEFSIRITNSQKDGTPRPDFESKSRRK